MRLVIPGLLSAMVLLLALTPAEPSPDSSAASYGVVLKASMFTIGPVGFAARMSDEESAFRSLLADSKAKDQFRKLAKQATPAGQLYALLGLKLLGDPAYRDESKRLGTSVDEVTT